MNTDNLNIKIIDEEVKKMSVKRYGDDPNSWGAQRDGFIEGFKTCLKHQSNTSDEPIEDDICLHPYEECCITEEGLQCKVCGYVIKKMDDKKNIEPIKDKELIKKQELSKKFEIITVDIDQQYAASQANNSASKQPIIHFATLDKMPTIGLLDREGILNHVVTTAKKYLADFASQANNSIGNGWVSDKPDFKGECTFVTATTYDRNSEDLSYDYAVWQIKKIDGEDELGKSAWYLGLLDGEGEEWGPLEDLSADLYYIIPEIIP